MTGRYTQSAGFKARMHAKYFFVKNGKMAVPITERDEITTKLLISQITGSQAQYNTTFT
jgi:hypothetical protein